MPRPKYQTGEIVEEKFKILMYLGEGRFSEVYRAHDLIAGEEECVLKVLRPKDEGIDALASLRNEIDILKDLGEHTHIARLLDANRFSDGDLYLKLEYIEGQTVAAYLRAGKDQGLVPPLPVETTRRAALDLLDALAFMHERPEPILHRDINPNNLILSPTRGLVIIDFNVSKILVNGMKAMTIVGTPPYIPPEIMKSSQPRKSWNVTCDIYAVGIVLYSMLTGQDDPFHNSGDRLAGVPPKDPRKFYPGLSPAIADIALKAIEYNSDHRYQSAQAMREDILSRWPVEMVQGMLSEPEATRQMTVGDLAEIESRLKETEDVLLDEGSTAVDDLVRIRHQLDHSMSACPVKELPRLQGLRSRYEQLATPVAQQLRQSCDEELKNCEGRILSDAQELDQALGHVRHALDHIVGLFPAHHSQPEIQALQTRLDALSSRLTRARRLKTLRNQVSDLWKRADKVEEARDKLASGYAIALCKEALLKVDTELQSGSDWEPDETDELYVLRGEAQRCYDNLRNRHEIPTTKQRGEELVPLIIDFAERVKHNPSELVTYFVSAEPAAQTQPMEVAKALEVVRQRLLDLIWLDKIEQCIRDADSELKAHKPRDAMAALRAWESLPGLYDERVGVALPRNLTLRIDDAERRIKPDLEALKQAEIKAREACLETDPLKAHHLMQEAQATYAYLSGLDQVRAAIVETARSGIDRLLKKIQERLEKEDWGLCESRLERVKQLLALDPTLDSEFQDQYGRLQHIYDDVHPLTLQAKERLRLEEERALLDGLEQKYKDSYWGRWSRLQERVAELQARGDAHKIQSEVDALCTPEASVEALESLHRDCKEMNEHPPQSISATDQKQLIKATAKLEAWIGFARARDELEKASDLATIDDDTDVAVELVAAPDLEVAGKGIQAGLNDPYAAQAIRNKRLSERLSQLRGNDARAKQAVEGARRLLTPQSLDGSREALRQVNQWLRKPTSYRAELLELRHDAQLALLREIEAEIRKLIFSAREDWYISLDTSVIEDLLEEIAPLPPWHLRLGEAESLSESAEGPIEVAKAHRLEQAAEQGNVSWDRVKSAWEAAGEKAKRDTALWEYCLRRAKQSYKRTVFIQAQSIANPDRAERILRSLCEDTVLREDWNVWFRHGTHCLESAQVLLRTLQVSQLGASPSSYLSWARESLSRTSRIASDGSVSEDVVVQVQNALAELELWEKLANAQQAIQLKLESSGGRLTASACSEARKIFEAVTRSLGAAEPLQVLEKFWSSHRATARAALDAQFARSKEIFDRVDALLGVSILFPADEMAKGKLSGLVTEALRQIKEEVSDAVFDSTAERFLARYARRARGGPPEDKDVVRLQLGEAQELIGHIETLKTALGILPGQLTTVDILPAALDEEKEHLRDWEKQLRDMQRAMDQALRLARDGLRVPEQFEKAKYILWQSSSGGPAYLRVPPTFKDQSHPSYGWCQEQVNQLQERRTDQEKLRRRIELCLKHEQVTKPDDLPSDVRDPEERTLVHELRQRLQVVHRSYPIEQALKIIREMQHQEPDDACELQEKMSYRDPEDGHRLYESLTSIREVIQRKVNQIYALRGWLGQFASGTVDWDKEQVRIEQLRDSGLHGLMKARMECQNICLGVEGLCRGLSREEMLADLRRGEEIAGLDVETGIGLCAVAQSIDREREEMQQRLGLQIEECLSIEQDIRRRIERYESSWDRFVNAYMALMKLKANWRKSKQWRAFRQAAEKFCAICPNDDEFQKALNEVHEKTGVQPPCLKEQATFLYHTATEQ